MFKNQDEHSEEIIKELLGKIKHWYNGYTVPDIQNKYYEVYNPYAVINYLGDCVANKSIIDGNHTGQSLGQMSSSKYSFLKRLRIRTLSLGLFEPTKLEFRESTNLTEVNFA